MTFRAVDRRGMAGMFVALVVLVAAAPAAADTRPEVKFSVVGNTSAELTDDISEVTGESVHFKGEVNPENGPSETLWRFEYATSSSGPWVAVPGGAGKLAGDNAEFHVVEADLSGLTPGTTYYARLVAENAGGQEIRPGNVNNGLFVTPDAPSVSTFAAHGLAEEQVDAIGGLNPHGATTRYAFEYATQDQFERSGFGEAGKGPEIEVVATPKIGEFAKNTGDLSRVVAEALPSLQPGETYHYRLVATNEIGTSVAAERVLTTPAPAPREGVAGCPNEAARSASVNLPDCRAYEQVTPIEKHGAMDIFNYGVTGILPTFIAEDGERVMLRAPGVQWGSSPDASLSEYFFSRAPGGWPMGSVTPQPEAGIESYRASVFGANLNQLGVEVGWETTNVTQSSSIEFDVGPPGGPYARAASVARSKIPQNGGWVAASADGSKLILEVDDHTLLGHSTGTTSGADLYEYAGEELRQVNVLTNGGKISACGATIAHVQRNDRTLPAISADGSRVLFFDNCTKDLYMRVDGAQTVDVGAYGLRSAAPDDSKLLLERDTGGGGHEFFAYDSVDSTVEPLFDLETSIFAVHLSGDGNVVYVEAAEQLTADAPPISEGALIDLYRYDVSEKQLRFVIQIGRSGEGNGGPYVSGDGRYYYWAGTGVAGVFSLPSSVQAYRYDDQEKVISCLSCASSFNPRPQREAFFPEGTAAVSSNGDYVIFSHISPLVPEDVDGEHPTKLEPGGEYGNLNNPEADFRSSVSSDVYEWRRNGVDGCSDVEGCLALISSGTGGLKNLALGIDPSGRDIFFATHSQLVPQDIDTAGDIYDARMDGGFEPPPPPPTECEGDACSTPLTAPIDTTPASLSFSGPGNFATPSKAKLKKPKARKHKRKRSRRRSRKTGRSKKARRSSVRGGR